MRYVLGWWLNPDPAEATSERERLGIWIVLACYVVFLVIFALWPEPAP